MIDHLVKVREGFTSLSRSPTELWVAYALKFLDSYCYFSFSIILTLFLSREFGFSDIAAGTIYGGYGALVTIYGCITGWIVDNLGVACSLRVGFFLSLLSRILIFATTSRSVILVNMCFLLPFSNCLGIPVLSTGIRRYTVESNRTFALGLFYVILNVAALISGPVVDALTIFYKQTVQDEDAVERTWDQKEWSLTSHRAIILTGIVANVVACAVTLLVREIKVVDNNKTLSLAASADNGDLVPCNSALRVKAFVPTCRSPCEIFHEVIQMRSFWRFLIVCLITVNVRMIYRHLDATFPKYMMREFGKDVPKGTIYSINPALIIILVPLVSAVSSKTDPLIMIHRGSYISAASVFILAISTSIPASILFVVVLSVGESMWSPRLYDYTMSVVKEGREGTHMALSSAPLFLAKLPVGFVSGFLLQEYCPKDGERHSKVMWLIIGLATAVSPILLTVFWSHVTPRADEETEFTRSHEGSDIGELSSAETSI